MTRPHATAGPRRTPPDPLLLLAIAAAAVTIALTAAGFWLSYERLHDLAAAHDMAHSAARAWVWPACVDMFIVVGEILILRSSLARRVDVVAIALTTIGSLGSIALNVAAVGGHVSRLDYIVAAIPPAAALLAFGALMRQIHSAIAARVPAAVPVPEATGYTPDQAYPPVYPLAAAAPAKAFGTVPRPPAEPPAVPALYPVADLHVWPQFPVAVPAGVPGDRTRVHPAADAVLDEDAIEPDPDPDPAADRTDEDLAEQLLRTYATELLDGTVPSIRTIRRELGVGQARAQRLQLLLSGVSAG